MHYIENVLRGGADTASALSLPALLDMLCFNAATSQFSCSRLHIRPLCVRLLNKHKTVI